MSQISKNIYKQWINSAPEVRVKNPYYDYRSDREKRAEDMAAGRQSGREIFRDEEMMQMRGRLSDLSKGYSGQELGAIRAGAMGEIAGQRGQYLRQLASRAGRAGIGGARAAAMQAAADRSFLQQRSDAERKMALDSSQLVRSGTKDLQDYIMRQRLGELSTGFAEAQMGVSERTSRDAAKAATRDTNRGILGKILEPFFG